MGIPCRRNRSGRGLSAVHLLEECFLGQLTLGIPSVLPAQMMRMDLSPNLMRTVTLPGQRKWVVPARQESRMSLPYRMGLQSLPGYGTARQHLAAPPLSPINYNDFLWPSLMRMETFYGSLIQAVMSLREFLHSATAVHGNRSIYWHCHTW